MSDRSGIQLKNVSYHPKSTDGTIKSVLTDLSFQLNPSTFSLVTGKTGAGKSSLIHLIAGVLRPTEGEIFAEGDPVSRWTSVHRDLWRRKVGIVFQHPHLLNDLTVIENIMVPLVPTQKSLSSIIDLSDAALEKLNISHTAQKKVSEISGGEMQRVGIARAICSNPSYLLADEPTAFQDDGMTDLILSLFSSLTDSGAVVLIASHDERVRRKKGMDNRFHLSKGRMVETDDCASYNP